MTCVDELKLRRIRNQLGSAKDPQDPKHVPALTERVARVE
jgi:hypothetical protein